MSETEGPRGRCLPRDQINRPLAITAALLPFEPRTSASPKIMLKPSPTRCTSTNPAHGRTRVARKFASKTPKRRRVRFLRPWRRPQALCNALCPAPCGCRYKPVNLRRTRARKPTTWPLCPRDLPPSRRRSYHPRCPISFRRAVGLGSQSWSALAQVHHHVTRRPASSTRAGARGHFINGFTGRSPIRNSRTARSVAIWGGPSPRAQIQPRGAIRRMI